MKPRRAAIRNLQQRLAGRRPLLPPLRSRRSRRDTSLVFFLPNSLAGPAGAGGHHGLPDKGQHRLAGCAPHCCCRHCCWQLRQLGLSTLHALVAALCCAGGGLGAAAVLSACTYASMQA